MVLIKDSLMLLVPAADPLDIPEIIVRFQLNVVAIGLIVDVGA